MSTIFSSSHKHKVSNLKSWRSHVGFRVVPANFFQPVFGNAFIYFFVYVFKSFFSCSTGRSCKAFSVVRGRFSSVLPFSTFKCWHTGRIPVRTSNGVLKVSSWILPKRFKGELFRMTYIAFSTSGQSCGTSFSSANSASQERRASRIQRSAVPLSQGVLAVTKWQCTE